MKFGYSILGYFHPQEQLSGGVDSIVYQGCEKVCHGYQACFAGDDAGQIIAKPRMLFGERFAGAEVYLTKWTESRRSLLKASRTLQRPEKTAI